MNKQSNIDGNEYCDKASEIPVSEFPLTETRSLEIVLKISERCNLACDYCYFFFAGDDTWKQHPATMGTQTVHDALAFACDAVARYGISRLLIVLHGGEPMLVGKRKFREICTLLSSGARQAGVPLMLIMQTNATLIDAEWIDLFSEFGIFVGVSLDGPRAANDLHRLTRRGKSSYDATVRGIRLLQCAADAGQLAHPSLICVINGEMDGRLTYRHFVDELGFTHLSFLTPDVTHDTIASPAVLEGVKTFMLATLAEWLGDDDPRVSVRFLNEPFRAMLNKSAARATLASYQDIRHVLSVSSSGELGPEDTLRTVDPRFALTSLHVSRHGLNDLVKKPFWREIRAAAEEVPDGCVDCQWWTCCKGGRLINRFSKANGFNNRSVFCNALQAVYGEMVASLERAGVPAQTVFDNLSVSAS